ncbi:MAG: 2-C-methyl-D-erythritol 4-phosphate cytidylyltransferase [Pseudomonadota bacterium]
MPIKAMPTKSQPQPLSNAHYWIIVPAAGVGSRMGSEIPKQYLTLGAKTIIEHTLERLLGLSFVAGIVIVISENDTHWPELPISKHPLIYSVAGGAERAISVLNGLHYLYEKIQPQDWVLVHDAARPCVTLANIETLCATLSDDAVGGILATLVSDTLKQVDAKNTILKTIDRRSLWQAQTPQLFRYQLLCDCLSQTLVRGENITDEASAVELCGYAPKVVEGRSDNIKITRADDLLLAAFILQQQEKTLQLQETNI